MNDLTRLISRRRFLQTTAAGVATFAIGDAGAQNAGLFAVALIAGTDNALKARLVAFRATQEAKIKATVLPPPG